VYVKTAVVGDIPPSLLQHKIITASKKQQGQVRLQKRLHGGQRRFDDLRKNQSPPDNVGKFVKNVKFPTARQQPLFRPFQLFDLGR